MAIVTDDIELLVGFTQDKKELKSKLDELKARIRPRNLLFPQTVSNRVPFGRGFQYSALMAVLKEAFDDEDERPIIIMQTDGGEAFILRNPTVTPFIPPDLLPDWKNKEETYLKHFQEYQRRNPREFSLDDVYKAAATSRATIYTVVPGFRLIGLSPEEQLAQTRAYLMREFAYLGNGPFRNKLVKRLERMPVEDLRLEALKRAKLQSALAVLSTVTGGWINFFDQPSQAADIYSRVLSDINRRYIIGYYPTNKEHDGKRRKVSIEVRGHPEYMLIGRKGYYALDPDQ
jgi:VWFA-related protein